MKDKHILKETLDIQKAYLPRLNFDVKSLYADLRDFQSQLLDALKVYGTALDDRRNPALIKVFGKENLDYDVAAANARVEMLQNFIFDTLNQINHCEFYIREIKKNLKIS